MISIQQLIERVLKSEQASVLAQIVHVEGSAYRKEGAWMFFMEDGTSAGLLGGGCIENDLQQRAADLYNSGETIMIDFDLRSEDDLGWGRGAGCNGIVTVLLRGVDQEFRKGLQFLLDQLKIQKPVHFSQELDGAFDYQFYSSEERYGSLETTKPQTEIAVFHEVAGKRSFGNKPIYTQWIWPNPSLHIIGAGADARPLASLAAAIGYTVNVYDWRGALCTKTHFPTAASLKFGQIDDLIDAIGFTPMDSVVIMTHDFQIDKQIIDKIKSENLLYVGLLGSKRRTMRLIGGEIPHWLRSPIGLSIGAEGPEEIAISILAEMIAVRRGVGTCQTLASI